MTHAHDQRPGGPRQPGGAAERARDRQAHWLRPLEMHAYGVFTHVLEGRGDHEQRDPGRPRGPSPGEAAWPEPLLRDADRTQSGRIADLGGALGRGAGDHTGSPGPGPRAGRARRPAAAAGRDRRRPRRSGDRRGDRAAVAPAPRRRTGGTQADYAAGAAGRLADDRGPAGQGDLAGALAAVAHSLRATHGRRAAVPVAAAGHRDAGLRRGRPRPAAGRSRRPGRAAAGAGAGRGGARAPGPGRAGPRGGLRRRGLPRRGSPGPGRLGCRRRGMGIPRPAVPAGLRAAARRGRRRGGRRPGRCSLPAAAGGGPGRPAPRTPAAAADQPLARRARVEITGASQAARPRRSG